MPKVRRFTADYSQRGKLLQSTYYSLKTQGNNKRSNKWFNKTWFYKTTVQVCDAAGYVNEMLEHSADI